MTSWGGLVTSVFRQGVRLTACGFRLRLDAQGVRLVTEGLGVEGLELRHRVTILGSRSRLTSSGVSLAGDVRFLASG